MGTPNLRLSHPFQPPAWPLWSIPNIKPNKPFSWLCHGYSLEFVALCFLFSDLVHGLNREVTSNGWANTAVEATPVHCGKAVGSPPVTLRSGLSLKGHWPPNSKLARRRLRRDSCLESPDADFTQEVVF